MTWMNKKSSETLWKECEKDLWSLSRKLKSRTSHLFFFSPACRDTVTPMRHSKLHASRYNRSFFLITGERQTAVTLSDQAWTHQKAKATCCWTDRCSSQRKRRELQQLLDSDRNRKNNTMASEFVNISARIQAKQLVNLWAALTRTLSSR